MRIGPIRTYGSWAQQRQKIAGRRADLSNYVRYELTIDEARVRYAYKEYKQNIEKFTLLLHSKNPDHYKRAGALLHALYQSSVITNLSWDEGEVERLEGGTALELSYDDAQFRLNFINFFQEFHNQLLAFDLAFRCCAVYETNTPTYDFKFLHDICYYLRENSNLNVASLYMMFRSMMLR